MDHSKKQLVYLYQVILSNSTLYLHLPNLQSFKTGRETFHKTTSLSLSSNSIQFYLSLYLPNLQSFETGDRSFSETTSLSLSGNSI